MRMQFKVKRILPALVALVLASSAFTISGCAENSGATGAAASSGATGTKSVEVVYGLNHSNNTYSYVPKDGEEQAFDFTWTGVNGTSYNLSDFEGKPVLLNFWATWCPPCKGEMPLLEQIYQEYKGTDLVMLAVSVGENPSTVRNFIEKNGYNFRVLADSKQSVATKYQVNSIPTTYFIDANGIIQKMAMGAFPDKATLEAYLGSIIQ